MKYLILRRISQILILLLYFAANAWGVNILAGDISSSRFLNTIPLADPFALLQMLFAGALLSSTVITGAIIIFLFYALIGGRAFCAWVCPINMVTDLAN